MFKSEFLKFDVTQLSNLSFNGTIKEESGYFLVYVDQQFIQKTFLNISAQEYNLPSHEAHISVIYPDEIVVNKNLSSQEISFSIQNLGKFHMKDKVYLALIVQSKDLERYRAECGLSPWPSFKGVTVPFHITVAKKSTWQSL